VTGGTGSLGKRLVSILMETKQYKRVIIYSRDWHKQEAMQREYLDDPDDRLRFFTGDICDRDRLKVAMRGVDDLIHAAAYKSVPFSEYNPTESVRINVIGTQEVARVADECGIGRAMFIGTDKGCEAMTLYGAAKSCAEKLWIHYNAYTARGVTSYAAVRYGNVFDSSGGVAEKFYVEGELTVTDPEMTRFFFTTEEAAQFVLSSLGRMRGGEVFVPKLSAASIQTFVDVFDKLVVTVGAREGEKGHEILISRWEASRTRDMGDYYVVLPVAQSWEGTPVGTGCDLVPDDFEFSSDNAGRIGADELRELYASSGSPIGEVE